jgi:septum formation protein
MPAGSDLGFDLVLASASPRRRELLEQLGLRLRVAPVDLDETPHPGERPADCVRRLAAAKCDAAVASLASSAATGEVTTVLAADTMVGLDGAIFGKPADAADARHMLERLAGRRHEVTTAYRIWRGPLVAAASAAAEARVIDRAVTTLVSFRLLRAAEIEAYAAHGEWRGKAGGYALQGIAGAFITELRGSHTSVIGLPVAEVLADLLAAGALADYPRAAFGAATT